MLQHVALEVRLQDVEGELAFWALLGYAMVEPPASLAHRATWLQSGETQLHLLYTDAPRAAGHIAILAPDFAATIAALTAAGFTPEPRTPHWDAPRAYARSPTGHLVELMAAPPPASRH